MAATVDVRYVKPVVLPRFAAPVARRRAPAALWQRRRTQVAYVAAAHGRDHRCEVRQTRGVAALRGARRAQACSCSFVAAPTHPGCICSSGPWPRST